VVNIKVFRIFILIKKFILFIFQSLDLREGIKTHYKMLKKKRKLLVSHILPTRNEVFLCQWIPLSLSLKEFNKDVFFPLNMTGKVY
jgi:hypothetical protein